MNAVGGLSAGIEIWELAYIPCLLNNSETWLDIEKSTIDKLDSLQTGSIRKNDNEKNESLNTRKVTVVLFYVK